MTEELDHETQRHRAEVRWCLRMGWEKFEDWCRAEPHRRTPEQWRRLRRDVKEQARLGNTGAPAEWKEETP